MLLVGSLLTLFAFISSLKPHNTSVPLTIHWQHLTSQSSRHAVWVLRVSRWVQNTRDDVVRCSLEQCISHTPQAKSATGVTQPSSSFIAVYWRFEFGNSLSFPSYLYITASITNHSEAATHLLTSMWPACCFRLVALKKERGNALKECVVNFPACSNKYLICWPGQGLQSALATANRHAIDLLVLKMWRHDDVGCCL